MTSFSPSPEQRAVIEAPLASLRVAAGAGTGKTATIAGRVVHLVGRGIEPEAILGITFTNKAAEELADRIRSAIAPLVEPGHEIEVHTYHGFGAAILREYGPLVGIERDAGLITPAYARQILAELLRRIPVDRFDSTVPSAVESLRRLGSSLSDNLLVPADVSPPPEPDEVWERRAEMLRILEHFEQEKRRLGVTDYGDLIRKTWELLSGQPQVAEAIAARYSAVLLDEYQDTDPAQREMLRLLFQGRVPVLAVGDEDQTIYEWRGASLQNFRRFPEHFATAGDPAPTLHLTLNRRSGEAVLTVANRIRERIDDSPRAPLVPLPGTRHGRVTTGWFETAVSEAEWIAGRLQALAAEGRRWRDMAILFRKNKNMLLVHDALARFGIPFEVANLGGLLSVPEVADLHAWLRVIGRPDDGPALARLLLGSRFRLGLGDLAVLGRWVRKRRGDDEAEEEESLPQFTLIEAVDDLESVEGLRPDAREALSQFAEEYRELVVAAQGLSLVELCRTVLDRTRAWQDAEVMEWAARLSARLNLYRFLDLAEDWSPLEGRPSLEGFLNHLDAMQEEAGEELDTARISEADAVTLITVHRAKGLEWPVVFIPAVYQRNFPSTGSLDNPLKSAEVLPFELRLDAADLPDLVSLDGKQQAQALRDRRDSQEWRIAYVGVTRAKEELYVTGAHWYGHPTPNQRPVDPSELFTLVDHLATEPGPKRDAPPRPDVLGARVEQAASPDPLFEEGWPAALRQARADPEWAQSTAKAMRIEGAFEEAVEGFQQVLFRLPEPPRPDPGFSVETSATGLVTYAACPRRYFWSEVDRLPRRSPPSARRGVEVHRRIERHHLGVVPLHEAVEDVYDLAEGSPGRGDPFEVFAGSRFAARRPLLVEVPFQLSIEDALIRGRIDAVYGDEEASHWEVVDFKSGVAREDPAAVVQLQTYAMAVREVQFGLAPPEQVTVTFAYLGGEELVERSYAADPAWTAEARERVVRLTRAIRAERWDPSPSDACRRCDFLRFCPAGRAHAGGEGG